MKKIACALTLVAMISPACAGAPDVPPVSIYSGFDGFTLGIAGAYYHATFDVGIANADNNTGGSTTLEADAPYFHGQLGYGHAINQFYIGFNLFADVGQAQASGNFPGSLNSPAGTTDVTSTLKNVYGIVLKPGIVVYPQWLVYGIGGLAVSNDQVSTTLAGVEGLDNTYATGYIAGGGVEYLIGKHFSIDAEGAYLKFGEHTAFLNGLFGEPFISQQTHSVRALLGLNLYI